MLWSRWWGVGLVGGVEGVIDVESGGRWGRGCWGWWRWGRGRGGRRWGRGGRGGGRGRGRGWGRASVSSAQGKEVAGTGRSRRVGLWRNRFAYPPGPETGQQARNGQRDRIPVPDSDLGHQLQHVLAFARPQVQVARNPGIWGIQNTHQPRKETVCSHVQHSSCVSPPRLLGTGL